MRNPTFSLQPEAERAFLTSRLPQLDAVRGVAAFVVVLHHAFLSFPFRDPARLAAGGLPGLQLIVLGRPAVILFFVLSGFVLTRSLLAAECGWRNFALRRMVRLLPPFWVVILAAFLAARPLASLSSPLLSSWFNSPWSGEIGGDLLLRHVLMAAGPQYPLDHVVWSLVHELRFSLLLPLIVIAARRLGPELTFVICLSVSAAADLFIAGHPQDFPRGHMGFLFDAPGLWPSLALTAHFLACFALGAWIASRYGALSTLLGSGRLKYAVLFLIAGFGLSSAQEWQMGLGAACLLIVASTSASMAAVLAIAPLAWLGRVSFSLYLAHIPIFQTLGRLAGDALPAAATLSLAVVVSLILAQCLYLAVEAPCVRASRWIVSRKPAAAREADFTPATLEAVPEP